MVIFYRSRRRSTHGSALDAAGHGLFQPLLPLLLHGEEAAALQAAGPGAVRVGFDIDENGFVRNARVLKSKPKKLFDESALEAIGQYRYKPKVVDGEYVLQRDATVTLYWEFEGLPMVTLD